jgi:hypothetical protein
MKTVIALICLIIPCSISGHMLAKETSKISDTQIQAEKKSATDNIFNEIMQSLPENVKIKLDSLKINKSVSEKNKPGIYDKQNSVRDINIQNQTDLSDDLKKRVRQAMEEIDHQQSKRQIQFKESQKKK